MFKVLKTGEGSHVQTSLMEAMLDFQFEVLTTYLNNGRKNPKGVITIMPMLILRHPMEFTKQVMDIYLSL